MGALRDVATEGCAESDVISVCDANIYIQTVKLFYENEQ